MSDFDEKVVDRIKRLEREVERLRVKESPIMSNYLLTTGKAADADKLDGLDSTAFLLTTGKAADSDKLDGMDSTAFVEVSDPIGFWIAPGSFGTGGGWLAYGNNYVPNLVNAATTYLDTFISIPVAGKRLELTGLMTSNSTGNIDAGVELRRLQEAAGQPSGATFSDTLLFTISPAYAVRKKTVTFDLSSYSAGETFALRFYRLGASTADTCSGHGYFFGLSGRWID